MYNYAGGKGGAYDYSGEIGPLQKRGEIDLFRTISKV